jgi:hypothetical protein
MKVSLIVINISEIFVFVGKTEVHNKIASYTTDQKVFLIKTFYLLGFLCCCGDGILSRVFISVAPLRDTIYRTVKQFEET